MTKLTIFYKNKEIQTLVLDNQKEYLGGRSKDCDICLSDAVFSRQHFKIFFKDGNWAIQAISKSSKIIHNGEDCNFSLLQPTDEFSAFDYTFKLVTSVEQQAAVEIDVPTETPQVQFETQENIQEIIPIEVSEEISEIDSEEVEEKTFIPEMTSQDWSYGVPFLIMKSASGKAKTLRLEGDYWTAGREDSCDIIIDDTKASREHFEIVKKQSIFSIMDKKSANATYLNNRKLQANRSYTLRSGDTIQVGKVLMVFEIRDPLFNDKMTRLPVEAQPQSLASPPESYIHAPSYEQKVIKLPRSNQGQGRKFLMTVVALAIVAVVYLQTEEEQNSQNLTSKSPPSTVPVSPIDQLSPEQKDLVEKSYNLAKTLYTQGKYELAMTEIEKIHKLVPQYKDSKEIVQFSKNAIDTLFEQNEIARQEEAQKLQVKKVAEIVDTCEKDFLSSKDASKLETCLEPALEIDPENAKSKTLFEMAERNEIAKDQQSERQAKIRSQIQKRKVLFAKAEALRKEGKILDAIESYNSHIASTLPDPDNLESKSKKEVQNLKEKINQDVKALTTEADDAYAKKDYRNAIKKLIIAIKLNPQDQSLKEKHDGYSKELYKIVKALYADSVLEENLGNIDSAKEKWKKIKELDVEYGDYYKKASSKIRKSEI